MAILKHLPEFEKILADYKPSSASRRILEETNLVLMLAPFSSGRNTIIGELLKTGDYHFIVSDTTRKPRVNDGVLEKNGGYYWFRSEEDVLADLKSGDFLEAEVIHGQQVSGISIRELKKASDKKKIAITDVDIGGVHSVLSAKPDTLVVLVLPPSFNEWQTRIERRGKMSRAEHRRRTETACLIFQSAIEAGDRFVYVINDVFKDAVAQVHQAAKHHKIDARQQTRGRNLVRRLYSETRAFLGSDS